MGDITKGDAVSERPYIECLNYLGYWLERDKKIEYENKQAAAKNK